MNNYLDSINTTIEEHFNKYFNKNDPMFQVCKYSMQYGKKIRPSISLDICKSLLNSTENVEFPCLLVEYLHTASLIIDDLPCMDNAEKRRDNPSTHVKFGEAVTQLSSVVFLSLAMDALNKGLENNEDMMKIGTIVLSKLSKILGSEGVAGGQMLDLALSNKDVQKLYNEKIDINDMILKKTGALFELSFLIGWLFGKGDIDKIDNIRDASKYFSMIYQILDDLEDVEEDLINSQKNSNVSKNYVINNGKEESVKHCSDYINKFKMEMIKLNIYSDYFKELMKYVKEKLEKYK
jgi:geranylgeranyl diphosphate synthase type II